MRPPPPDALGREESKPAVFGVPLSPRTSLGLDQEAEFGMIRGAHKGVNKGNGRTAGGTGGASGGQSHRRGARAPRAPAWHEAEAVASPRPGTVTEQVPSCPRGPQSLGWACSEPPVRTRLRVLPDTGHGPDPQEGASLPGCTEHGPRAACVYLAVSDGCGRRPRPTPRPPRPTPRPPTFRPGGGRRLGHVLRPVTEGPRRAPCRC